MTKLPKFNSRFKNKKYNFTNRLLSKSISSKVVFKDILFFNTNLRGSRLRGCIFKNTRIYLSDFSGVILNKNRFKDVHFKKCVFYATIFRQCRFTDCIFEQCIFINTDTLGFQEYIRPNCKQYSYYQLITDECLEKEISMYKNILPLQKNRLLHIRGGKVNKATFFILLNKMDKSKLLDGLSKIYLEKENPPSIYSTFKLFEELQKTLELNLKNKQNRHALPHPIERLDN